MIWFLTTNENMYLIVWIATATLLYSASLAVELPERPHSIFDEFLHKYNVKSGKTPKHSDTIDIPRLENFIPDNPLHSRVPELPSKYHGIKGDKEYAPFQAGTLPSTILKERTHKPASSSPPTPRFGNPKYEHSDVTNKEVPERPHSVFDEFFHKFNVKSGENPEHTDKHREPRLENFFIPPYPSHSRVPEFPSTYHAFRGDDGHTPFQPDTLPPTILKERTHKPASSSPPTPRFADPKYEHSYVVNKRDEIMREARKNPIDFRQFIHLLDEFQKLSTRNEMSHAPSPHNLSSPSWRMGRNNGDRKHFGNYLNGFTPKNHPTHNHFAESQSSLVPSRQLQNLLLDQLETKLPPPGYGDLKHKPFHVNKIHEPPQFPGELQMIKDFLSQSLRKFEFPNYTRIANDEKNPTAVELDFSESNKTNMDRKVLRTLIRELPIRPDFQKVYKLKLLVKPPNDSNTTFVKDFVTILRNITTNLIPDAIIASKITAFKKDNTTLSIFQVNLYIKYLNRMITRKIPTTNDSYDIASEKILNNKNEVIIELEENKNDTMEIVKINLGKLTSDYKKSLNSILYELLENTTRSDGFNKSIVLISIKLPNHRSIHLTDTLFKTAQSVMCSSLPHLITFDNLKIPQRRSGNSPRIEILIPIQETNFLYHLGHLNLTQSYGKIYMEISRRVPRILNVVTRCRPENSTINFNFTMLLPKLESNESIKNILREVTNIARKVVPHHRIYIEAHTATIDNNLNLRMNITMKPSEIHTYHNGTEKEISIDLRRSGSSVDRKIRNILPKLIKEIEKSPNPVSLIFNISFPLGINKDFVRGEILALISILEEAIPVEYGTIANVILQITVLPTEVLRENEIVHDIKFHNYVESLMKTTESFTAVEQSNTTESSNSSSINRDILERSTEKSIVTKHASNISYPPFKGWPEITANRNPYWNHKPKVSYPRWRTPPISSHKTSIFEKPNLIPLRSSSHRRRHWPSTMFGRREKTYKTPLHSYSWNKYSNFPNSFNYYPKNDLKTWRRPVSHASFRTFPSNIMWPRMTRTNSYTSETEATTTSLSNLVENWAEPTETPSSSVYHTRAFRFPIWRKQPSTTGIMPNSFGRIPEIYRRSNLPSHTTSRYERFPNQTLKNEEYPHEQFKQPWKFYRYLGNEYDEFHKSSPHPEKYYSKQIPKSWSSPLHEENFKNSKSTTQESTTLRTEASTASTSNLVENWTEPEKISSSSAGYHSPEISPPYITPSYEISTENSNGQPQKIYRYLKHKYHKFHKLPHHLKKKIWKVIESNWKKATNEKKIKKILSKILWPLMRNGKTNSATFESSPSTLSSNLFENSEITTESDISNLENFGVSSTYSNAISTTPTSETTAWTTTETSSNPSSSSVQTTYTKLSETTTSPTVFSSSSEAEATSEVTSSETSSLENETTKYLEQSSTVKPNEYSTESTTTYPTSNEATISNSPEQTTFPPSYSAYANLPSSYRSTIYEELNESTPGSFLKNNAPNDFQVQEPNFFLPSREISPAITTSNERPSHVLSSTEMNKAEEPNSNIIPENITPETAPFLDEGNLRKIPRFRQTKLKLTKLPNWVQNNFPSEHSIQESLTSRRKKGGEVIDKETSQQYIKNGQFNVRKRTLNFSNSNSDMLSEIERKALLMLRKNGNEPTILLFKIIPNEGMMVSDLRSLTEPLLSSLISDLPTSEINIITKAYYNKNQEIKSMKMKIAINYSNDETTKNENQLEENTYLVEYLKIMIHKILEHIEINSSDQQITQFNFTIDCPSELGKTFKTNLIQSSEAILSQVLPYENVDIIFGNTHNDSNDSSCSMNVFISPISKTHRIVWAPVIHLDGLSFDHFKHKIQHSVLEYLFSSSSSDQNISAVMNFAFETNKVTSFDIIGLENSISDILDEMQISGKFLSTDARLELTNKKGIIIKMPFAISTTKKALLRYLKNSYKRRIANTKNIEPSGRISDLLLED